MKTEQPDIHVDELSELLSFLEPVPAITAVRDVWGSRYRSQRDHMVLWLVSQPTKGGGQYSRGKGNTSARKAYNRMQNPGMLLWMAEVLGEDTGALERAVNAAMEAEKVDRRRRCNAFREVIGFDRIMELLGEPGGWKYNRALERFMEMDEAGYPHVKRGMQEEYLDALGMDA